MKQSYLNQLNPYKVPKESASIKLDSNEININPLMDLPIQKAFNRYPSSENPLIEALAKNYQVKPTEIIIDNGSSAILDLIVRTFTEPNDTLLTFSPSFSMYKHYALTNNVNFETVNTFDVDAFINMLQSINPKISIICNPNNPTGTLFSKEAIIKILKATDSMVVVDEAYMEFNEDIESLKDECLNYDNLIVTRTFSKAYGLAGLRVGYALANTKLIESLKKVRAPYTVNSFSLEAARYAINNQALLKARVKTINQLKATFETFLEKHGIKYLKSFANFVYISVSFDLKQALEAYDISIRKVSTDQFRITVSNKQEMQTLMQAMEAIICAT